MKENKSEKKDMAPKLKHARPPGGAIVNRKKYVTKMKYLKKRLVQAHASDSEAVKSGLHT